MTRQHTTYLGLALVLMVGAVAAFAALIFTQPAQPVEAAACEQAIIGHTQVVYLGSASDPGGGEVVSAITITISDDGTVATVSDPGGEGRTNNTDSPANIVTSDAAAFTPTITFVAIPVESQNGHLASAIDRAGGTVTRIDEASLPVLGLNDHQMAALAAYVHGNSTKAVHLRHGGAQGGLVAAPAHLACVVCKSVH